MPKSNHLPGSKWRFEVWTELSKSKEDDMPLVAQPSRSKKMPNVLDLIPRQFMTSAGGRSPTNPTVRQQAFIVHVACEVSCGIIRRTWA
jgi:hypothetical protein